MGVDERIVTLAGTLPQCLTASRLIWQYLLESPARAEYTNNSVVYPSSSSSYSSRHSSNQGGSGGGAASRTMRSNPAAVAAAAPGGWGQGTDGHCSLFVVLD